MTKFPNTTDVSDERFNASVDAFFAALNKDSWIAQSANGYSYRESSFERAVDCLCQRQSADDVCRIEDDLLNATSQPDAVERAGFAAISLLSYQHDAASASEKAAAESLLAEAKRLGFEA